MLGLDFLSKLIKPIGNIIDNVTTTDEEKKMLHNELIKIENSFAAKVLDYETKLMVAQASVINTEAKGESWLQRNWRPITMLVFLTLIVLHYLGLLAFPIADQMWALLKIGIGGYIVSRGVEKTAASVAPKILDVFKKDKG